MSEFINLRGLIVSKFGSISKFSDYIGWCYSKSNRIVNGKQDPDAKDIKKMVEALEINDPRIITKIFLS